MNFEPLFQFTTTPENAYRLALATLKQLDIYYYFDKILEDLKTPDQCLAYIDIEKSRLSKVVHYHPASFLRNITQAKIDLIYHRYSELRTKEILDSDRKIRLKIKKKNINYSLGISD